MKRHARSRKGERKAPVVPADEVAEFLALAPTAPARRQVAALPFRQGDQLEIMLISSRETRRWVLPKGWPMKGLSLHEAAAQEALEEAGLIGRTKRKPIGVYHYTKRMRNGAGLSCAVSVFPMRVEHQHRTWLEQAQRFTGWFSPAEAAELVDEPELSEILINFADRVASGDVSVLPNKMATIGDRPR